MDSEQLPSLLVGLVVGILFSYLVIKVAVSDAMSKMRQQAFIQTNLLIRMAAKAGVTNEEIQECIDDAKPKK